MKKLESIYSEKFQLNNVQMNVIQGGLREGENSYDPIKHETQASEMCPCGDYQIEHIYDGPWTSYMKDYCEMKQCNECQPVQC